MNKKQLAKGGCKKELRSFFIIQTYINRTRVYVYRRSHIIIMLLLLTLQQIDLNHVYFAESIPNTILYGGHFKRIMYSSPHFGLNGITLTFDLKHVRVNRIAACVEQRPSLEKHAHLADKVKVAFDLRADQADHSNRDICMMLSDIEYGILHRIASNKEKVLKLTGALQHGVLKVVLKTEGNTHISTHMKCIIKISGVWETDTQIGLTYLIYGYY